MRLVVIGIVIVMKAAFDRPDSHVQCTDGTRIWLECTLYYSYTLHARVAHCTYSTVHTTHHTLYEKQTVFHLDQKVDSATALRHRIAIIPIHPATLFSPLPRPNYKPQTKKGDPRKSLNWILGPIWWLRSAASRFKYTSYNLCQTRSHDMKMIVLTTYMKLPSLLQDCGLPISLHAPPALPGLTVDCRLLPCCSGFDNGRRSAIGWTGGAGQPGGQCWELPQANLAPAIPHLTYTSNKT